MLCLSPLGDIESMPFIEALRQLSFSVGKVMLHAISSRTLLWYLF